MEETGVPGENHQPVASHWQTLSDDFVPSTRRLSGIQTHNVNSDRQLPYDHDDGGLFKTFGMELILWFDRTNENR